MPATKRSVLKEPQVIVAVLTLVTAIATGIFTLLSKSPEPSNGSSVSVTNTLSPAGREYAAKLFSEAQTWPLIAKDTFDTNKYGWFEGDSATSKNKYILSIEDGIYSWMVRSNSADGSFVWPKPENLDIIPDFYLAVDAQNMTDLPSTGYGLTFRNQGSSNHYGFTIYSSQKFIVHYNRNDGGTTVKTPLASQTSKEILPYERNRIAVIGIGHQFWFYINDIFVNYINHDGPLTGVFGLAINTTNNKDEIHVEFDNFELREAP